MTDRLRAEIRRLYRLPDDTALEAEGLLRLVGPADEARTMVLALGRPADWSQLSLVWRGVQTDLSLPAPAIAVNGADAFELWFSLAQPVSQTQCGRFLQGLCERYLQGVQPHRISMRPGAEAGSTSATAPLIPAQQGSSGNWSAFVAPDLAAVFGDDPLLDLAPGNDAQAELLGRLRCISPLAFSSAMEGLRSPEAADMHLSEAQVSAAPGQALLAGPHDDPRRFLQAVMNAATVPMALRIEAAKALLAV